MGGGVDMSPLLFSVSLDVGVADRRPDLKKGEYGGHNLFFAGRPCLVVGICLHGLAQASSIGGCH